jgi:hypothetical protein
MVPVFAERASPEASSISYRVEEEMLGVQFGAGQAVDVV